MTPKTRPLEGGIFISPKAGDTPPLPAKKQYDNSYSPGEKVLDAQKQREQQLSEKEKGKLFDAEKRELHEKGLITEYEVYTIDSPEEELNRLVEARRERMGNLDPSQGYPGYPGQTGYPEADPGDRLFDGKPSKSAGLDHVYEAVKNKNVSFEVNILNLILTLCRFMPVTSNSQLYAGCIQFTFSFTRIASYHCYYNVRYRSSENVDTCFVYVRCPLKTTTTCNEKNQHYFLTLITASSRPTATQ
jgi:hypothetical protein